MPLSHLQLNTKKKELLFQVLLHLVLFVFYSFDRDHATVQGYQYAFFANYALGAFIINYGLIPRFFYKKKYIPFFFGLMAVLGIIMLIEEFILEKIFFSDTRGATFQGVVASLLDVMPIIIILAGFKFAWDASIKQHQLENLKSSARESELQFLKSQINPHFLFNNLNNLYSYAIDHSPKTPDIILELSTVLRYMLYDCRERYVPLSKEIEHLKNFSKLYSLQIENRGDVNFETDIPPNNYRIAPLILGVFLENAFKHSTSSLSENIMVLVKTHVTEKGQLHFFCHNSHGKQTNTENMPHGIGLVNVKKRLELLYPGEHHLVIVQKEDTFKVSLTLNLNAVHHD